MLVVGARNSSVASREADWHGGPLSFLNHRFRTTNPLPFRGGGGHPDTDITATTSTATTPSAAAKQDQHKTIVHNNNTVDGFTLQSETILHDKWRRLISRQVRLPSGLVADFEVVSMAGDSTDQAVLVFCWNTRSRTITLIREYMPAPHCKLHGLAAGMVEAHKHDNNDDNDDDDDMQLTAAKHELEEECRLTGGRWMRLTQHPVTLDKYSTTRMLVYLVLDAVPVAADNRKERDETEEGMEVVEDVTVDELRQKIQAAQLTVVGSWASLLALDKLREMGEID